jgi:hypothetical protein
VQEDRKGNNKDANGATKSPSSSAMEEGGEEQQYISNASKEIKDEMRKYEAKIMSGRIPQVGDSTRSDE